MTGGKENPACARQSINKDGLQLAQIFPTQSVWLVAERNIAKETFKKIYTRWDLYQLFARTIKQRNNIEKYFLGYNIYC